MTVNPYTLNQLYQKGILDFAPYDLCTPYSVGFSGSMQNPYMNSAMQGNLYQQYGNSLDSFNFSGGYNNTQIGSQSYATSNAFIGDSSIGSQAQNSIKNMFGFNGTGSQSDAGVSMFGATGVGGQSTAGGANAFGGFSDAQNNVSNSVNKAVSTFSNMPVLLKGVIAGGLILLTLGGLFKGKKPKNTESIWSKLNPFKKKSEPKPEPKGFFGKLKTCFKNKK